MKQRFILLLPILLVLASCASSTKATTPTADQQGKPRFELDRITFAVINTEGMVAFYERVFDTKFKRMDGPGAYLYEGKMFGITYLFVPNDVAGVRAEQSRYQIEVRVDDIDAAVQRVVLVGGTLKGGVGITGRMRRALVFDPDGNAIILLQED
jgi:predicted enzyme related to lactoylglutathione lyase